MKKIINGKKYDTDTAQLCASYSFGFPGSHNHWEGSLYRKKTGEFFLHGRGGANSQWAKAIDQNSRSGGSGILPMTEGEARVWVERHDNDKYEEIFGEVEE